MIPAVVGAISAANECPTLEDRVTCLESGTSVEPQTVDITRDVNACFCPNNVLPDPQLEGTGVIGQYIFKMQFQAALATTAGICDFELGVSWP